MMRTLIRATTRKIISSPARNGGTPPRDEMSLRTSQPRHSARHHPEQHAAPPRCGKPFQPAKIIDRGRRVCGVDTSKDSISSRS